MWITKVDKLKKIKLFKKNNKFRKRLPKNLLKQKNKKIPQSVVFLNFGGDDRIRTDDPLLARQMLQPTEPHPQMPYDDNIFIFLCQEKISKKIKYFEFDVSFVNFIGRIFLLYNLDVQIKNAMQFKLINLTLKIDFIKS